MVKLEVIQNEEGVLIDVEVTGMPEDFVGICVYETSRNDDDSSNWSTAGCILVETNHENSTCRCKCTHLSRFTIIEAGAEGTVISDVVEITTDSEDDTDFYRQPIMIYVTSFFWMLIIITVIFDRIVLTRKQRIGDKNLEPGDPTARHTGTVYTGHDPIVSVEGD